MKKNNSKKKTKSSSNRIKSDNNKPLENMNILDHIEMIVEISNEFDIDKCLSKAKLHIEYVSEKLGISPLQALLFSHFVNNSHDRHITIDDIASSVQCSRVRIVKYLSECEVLENKKLIRRGKRYDDEISYRVPRDVLDSLRKSNGFKPEKHENLSIEKLFTLIEQLYKELSDEEVTYDIIEMELLDLFSMNMHLHFCKKIMSYKLNGSDLVLLICFCNLFINYDNEDIEIDDIEFLYSEKTHLRMVKNELSEGSHPMMELKLVEFANSYGFKNADSWKLSDMAKEDLLSELNIKENKNFEKNLIFYDSVKPKKMFYNPREREEIQTLSSLLQEENFYKIQDRLEAKGMRKGFACLFSGSPGTGKTETAYQIARETKRHIMMVDISETKSVWFGESEKRIKKIFDNYRNAVKNSETAPILLFNEADAVIGRRKEFSSSSRAVDQTENTIQNIILQEMENLSGIMIATTNLTQNMDSAFERRFLYKINFDKPSIESRNGLWLSLIEDLPEAYAEELSASFELSGGQIENIARKIEVDTILKNESLSIDILKKYCKNENENNFNNYIAKRAGFDL